MNQDKKKLLSRIIIALGIVLFMSLMTVTVIVPGISNYRALKCAEEREAAPEVTETAAPEAEAADATPGDTRTVKEIKLELKSILFKGLFFLVIGVSILLLALKATRSATLKAYALIGFMYLFLGFMVLPCINTITQIFTAKQGDPLAVIEFFIKGKMPQNVWHSLKLALCLAVTVNVVGISIVLLTEYFDIKGARILRLGYMTTLIYSGVALVTGYLFLYDQDGMITEWLTKVLPGMDKRWFTGFYAVLFTMTFACTTNHALFLRNGIRGIDYNTVEAARNLGASPFKVLFRVVFPTLIPTLFSLTVMVFITGLCAMSAPTLLGYDSINPEIVRLAGSSAADEAFPQARAALLSIILAMFTIVLLTILSSYERKGHYLSVSKTKAKLVKQKINNPAANVLAHIYAYVLFIVYMTPVVMIVLFAFQNWQAIRGKTLDMGEMTPILLLVLGIAMLVVTLVKLRRNCGNSALRNRNRLVKTAAFSIVGLASSALTAWSVLRIWRAVKNGTFNIGSWTLINFFGTQDYQKVSGSRTKVYKDSISGVFSNTKTVEGIKLSFVMSAIAAAIACVVVVIAVNYIFRNKGKKRAVALEYSLLFPWLLPTVLICYSYRTYFNSNDVAYVFNQNLYFMENVRILIIIAYAVVKLPFALRMIKAAFYAIDDELEEAARNLGASGLVSFLRVKLPIVLPSVLAVFALNFNALFTEYDMSATFHSSYGTTYSMVIQSMCNDENVGFNMNATGRRCASTVFIMLVSGLILYLVYGVGARDLGERLAAKEKRRQRIAAIKAKFSKRNA